MRILIYIVFLLKVHFLFHLVDEMNGSDQVSFCGPIFPNEELKTEYVEETEQTPEDREKALRDAEEKQRKESELGKYWKTVEDNPMDFTGWTYLLQYVEQEVLNWKFSVVFVINNCVVIQ